MEPPRGHTQGRQFTPEDKWAILLEGRQPGMRVSEVCRRHQIAATQLYDWEAPKGHPAREGALASLRGRAPGRPVQTREAELAAEVARLRGVVVALSTENVQLKGRPSAVLEWSGG